MRLKRFAIVALLASPAWLVSSDAAAGPPADEYQIFVGLTAGEACSCAFVVGQTDAYCMALGSEEGSTAKITIDHTAMTATSKFLGDTRVSRYVAGAGCTLDGL